MKTTIPKEVIIVEGRDDTKRLIETFGPQIKTIETNGSAIPRKTLANIIQAAEQFGIIIFTDPDYQGDRIRRIVTQAVPSAKQAYLTQGQATSTKHEGVSLGVEHAHPQVIRQALANVVEMVENRDVPLIPISSLMAMKLIGHPQSKVLRERVSQHFHLGHLNGKQLQKRLSQYHISLEELQAFMEGGSYESSMDSYTH